jgi:hypothetical protein
MRRQLILSFLSEILVGVAQMKNIPLSSQPNFHGLDNKDPDAFLFEFDVLCRSYGSSTTTQKLKLFHATLKGASL